MTGPEHYRQAEDLAHDANLILERSTHHTAEAANAGAAALSALAQVHATLALVAAVANSDTGHDSAWPQALAHPPGHEFNDERVTWKDVLK